MISIVNWRVKLTTNKIINPLKFLTHNLLHFLNKNNHIFSRVYCWNASLLYLDAYTIQGDHNILIYIDIILF